MGSGQPSQIVLANSPTHAKSTRSFTESLSLARTRASTTLGSLLAQLDPGPAPETSTKGLELFLGYLRGSLPCWIVLELLASTSVNRLPDIHIMAHPRSLLFFNGDLLYAKDHILGLRSCAVMPTMPISIINPCGK